MNIYNKEQIRLPLVLKYTHREEEILTDMTHDDELTILK